MTSPSLALLTEQAARADEPSLTVASKPKFGGVDPLGLRQINFNLMDEVFPGLNNVARHVRPFVVISWAWRRANELAAGGGETHVKGDLLLDFVDRVEVLFAVSQLLNDSDADLPGKEYLKPLLQQKRLDFEGAEWQKRRKARRYSTALSAPVNYGPGLRALGWLVPHPGSRVVMLPAEVTKRALDALELKAKQVVGHPALSKLGPVSVPIEAVRQWGAAWSLESPTAPEREVMAELLFGKRAPKGRQDAGDLLSRATSHARTRETLPVRAAMAGDPSTLRTPVHLSPVREAWRAVQVRQLFRLSLESLLYWIMWRLQDGPRQLEWLVSNFMEQVPARRNQSARTWLSSQLNPEAGPVELIVELQEALAEENSPALPGRILAGLALSLAEPPALSGNQSPDRLPLSRAQEQSRARESLAPSEWLRHVIEAWVLAQHSYWSVGRGLADARSGGKILLRLKVVLDDGGWTLTPGSTIGGPPEPTRDRLHTAISLATECGLI